MILPSTYIFSLILLVLGMLCSGAWASTFKAAGSKWRFELYYFDFAIGVFLASILAAFTVGSLGWDGFSFLDDVRNAGKRQELFSFLAGCVVNMGNMLLLAAVAMTGISVAFPITLGVALVVGAGWSLILNPGAASLLLLGAGSLCLVMTAVTASMAYKAHTLNKLVALVQQGKTKSTKKSFSAKGLFLAVIGGVMLGSFTPLLDLARIPEIGLGPYGLAVTLAAGMVFSTFVYNLFFMNLPVQGKVLDLAEYFKGSFKAHYMGLIGGMLWISALLTGFVVARTDPPAQVPAALAFALSQGGTLISALTGLLVWKDFEEAESRVKTLVTSMMVLLVVGTALITVAPIYNAK